MKKILVAALLLTAPAFAMAQKGQKSGERRVTLSAEQRAERQTARVDKIVTLSPEQREKIQAENLRNAEAMQPHIDNIHSERQAMREMGKKHREAYANILTPDQQERLKAAHKEHRKARHMDGQRGGKNIEKAAAPKR